jgi:hypothetical protein
MDPRPCDRLVLLPKPCDLAGRQSTTSPSAATNGALVRCCLCMSAFLGFAHIWAACQSRFCRALLGGVAAFSHALSCHRVARPGGRGRRSGAVSEDPGARRRVEDSDGAVRPPAGLCRRPRSVTVMLQVDEGPQTPSSAAVPRRARAVSLRQAAEARRRSRRTSPDAAESGGGKGARNASQALAATGWELRTFAIGRSLAKLERRRQSVDESPAGLPAWAADDVEVGSPRRAGCTRRHQHQSVRISGETKARRQMGRHSRNSSRLFGVPPIRRTRLGFRAQCRSRADAVVCERAR